MRTGRYCQANRDLKCTALKILFGPDQILSQGTSAYDSFTKTYFSAQQGALHPSCVFEPSKTLDVSVFVLIARLYQCPFAVKGGGHAPWGGASSIEDGVTVSMENFKQVKVASDKQSVDIGPGLRWVDVYTAVEKSGLSVVGGRVGLRAPLPPTYLSLTIKRWLPLVYLDYFLEEVSRISRTSVVGPATMC